MKTKPIVALRFVSDTAEEFMADILGHSKCLHTVTAMSTIHDYGPWVPMTPGAYERLVWWRTWKRYGVDIAPVIRQTLPVIFHYLRAHQGDALVRRPACF